MEMHLLKHMNVEKIKIVLNNKHLVASQGPFRLLICGLAKGRELPKEGSQVYQRY